MKIIGLTGGIASGKSTVSQLLIEHGINIIDADKIAREVVQKGTIGLNKIVAHFGDEILNSDGTLNRKALGAIVFEDDNKLSALNGIMHPLIEQRIDDVAKYYQKENCKFIILDAPLLFEVGLDKRCNEVWLVVVNKDIQLQRLMARDGIELAMAEKIIASQMPLSEKMKKADVYIDNNGGKEALKKQVLELIKIYA